MGAWVLGGRFLLLLLTDEISLHTLDQSIDSIELTRNLRSDLKICRQSSGLSVTNTNIHIQTQILEMFVGTLQASSKAL